ncbi:MAG: GGDEF domain-containing protein [Coriobacteriales bacterium]|jgi:diguanylate cyclase (GGDEF)-like protein|nr:GGDEF domain-containing protein [Coriobacteriales bacterium]
MTSNPTAQRLFDYLRDAIYHPTKASLDPDELPEDFRDFGRGLVYYVQSIREATILAEDIARGDLNTSPLSPGNEVASGLKSLQASLRHLTWQTQQVAKGDYQQRVSFMGDFSEAMNDMIAELDAQRRELLNEVQTAHEESEALQSDVSRLTDISNQDPATGVYNRRFGMDVLEKWLAARREFVICFVDLDNLKYVNDEFGHAEGDAYISLAVELLLSFSRQTYVCRIGGDEFMLLTADWPEDSALERMAELRSQMIALNEQPGNLYHHSMSFGIIAIDASNTRTPGELLTIADERMYSFKRAHKAERKVY